MMAAAVCVAAVLSAPGTRAETPAPPPDLSSPQKIEAVFERALGLMQAGHPRQAVVLLRRILAQNPHLPRVRLELARAYFLMRSWASSREEFVAVLSGDVPRPVKKNILRFINAIDAQRGFDWTAQIGLAESPESGRNYKTDTVTLDFFGNKLPFKVDRGPKHAFGLSFKGSAELRRRLFQPEGGPSVVGFVSGSANLFEARGTASDDDIIGLAAGPRFIWPRTTAVLAANTSLRYKAGRVYEDRKGVTGSIEYRTESGYIPSAQAIVSDVNVHGTRPQDGWLYGLRAGASKSIFGSAAVGAYVGAQHFDARESYETYNAFNLELVAQADLGAGIGATARAGLWQTNYKATTPLFLERRRDRTLSVDLELVKTDMFLLGQFSPFLQVGYAHSKSTLGIYSYSDTHFMIGLKNAF